MVRRKIFKHRREEVAGDWKRQHNLYDSPNIIMVITSNRMRWVVHVEGMGEKINAYNILVGKT
jgi:hypothetical protein